MPSSGSHIPIRRHLITHLLVCTCLLASILFPIGDASVVLTKELTDLVARSAEFCAAVYKDEPGIPGATVFADRNGEPDAAMFVKEDDTCFAVFRGTIRVIRDWLQNLDFTPADVYSSSNVRCKVRRGFLNAFRASYVDLLELHLRDCVSSCAGGCDVVFTGHSQGGATSLIAAIVMDDLAPTVITFGEPPSVLGPCPPLNSIHHYHFVNTVRSGKGLAYDPVPFLPLDADDRGDVFLLNPDDDRNVVYYSDGGGPSARLFEWNVAAHADKSYIERLQRFQAAGIFPLGTSGWDKYSYCNEDSECISPKRCVDNACHAGMHDDPCNYDDDCDSGRCEGYTAWINPGKCKAKLSKGTLCDENSDCLSGRCSWWFRCT